MTPTSEIYAILEVAFEHFNRELFNNELNPVIFTYQRQKNTLGYFSPDRWGNKDGKAVHEIAINPTYLASSRLIDVAQTLVHEQVHQLCHQKGTAPRKAYHNKAFADEMIKVGLMPSSTGQVGGATTGQKMSDYVIENGSFILSFKRLLETDEFRIPWFDRHSKGARRTPVIANVDAEAEALKIKDDAEEGEGSTVNAVSTDSNINLDEVFGEVISEGVNEGFVEVTQKAKQSRVKYICTGCCAKVYGKQDLSIRCNSCGIDFIDTSGEVLSEDGEDIERDLT